MMTLEEIRNKILELEGLIKDKEPIEPISEEEIKKIIDEI